MRRDGSPVRKQAGEPTADVPGHDLDAGRERKEARIITCARCGHRLGSAERKVTVAGRHRHTCVNPAGFVFRIGCFASAPGCRAHGRPTDELSWFEGYAWQIGSCRTCGTHVGWLFTGDEPSFAGLILDRIEEKAA